MTQRRGGCDGCSKLRHRARVGCDGRRGQWRRPRRVVGGAGRALHEPAHEHEPAVVVAMVVIATVSTAEVGGCRWVGVRAPAQVLSSPRRGRSHHFTSALINSLTAVARSSFGSVSVRLCAARTRHALSRRSDVSFRRLKLSLYTTSAEPEMNSEIMPAVTVRSDSRVATPRLWLK